MTKTGSQCLLNAMENQTLCNVHCEPKCLMCGKEMTRDQFMDQWVIETITHELPLSAGTSTKRYTEGFCSYGCASGGGKTQKPEKPSTHTWCAKTKDHKHINGPVRIVGQSWHGPVHHWDCVECGYAFGDH